MVSPPLLEPLSQHSFKIQPILNYLNPQKEFLVPNANCLYWFSHTPNQWPSYFKKHSVQNIDISTVFGIQWQHLALLPCVSPAK